MEFAFIYYESRARTEAENLTRKTAFSLRGGKERLAVVVEGGAVSPSSKDTECAVTRAGKPAPSKTPAMLPEIYASTDNPPKSDGTLTKVLLLQVEKDEKMSKSLVGKVKQIRHPTVQNTP